MYDSARSTFTLVSSLEGYCHLASNLIVQPALHALKTTKPLVKRNPDKHKDKKIAGLPRIVREKLQRVTDENKSLKNSLMNVLKPYNLSLTF